MDYYKPRYNVLRIAGSSIGFHHSIETINKLKELLKKEKHPKYGTKSSVVTKKAISDALKTFYLNNSHHYKGKKGKLSSQYGIGGTSVFCYNKQGEELIFPSINGAVDCCSPGAVGAPDTVRCTPDSPVPPFDRWLDHASRADRAADRCQSRPLAHRTVRCTTGQSGEL